ncbi:MAG: oligosaccharide biosynthesis protein Alg14 [Bacteroidota bacterium]
MKVLAIASVGGHWVQLLRLLPAFDQMELVFVSTKESSASMVPGYRYYSVPDASRWNKFRLIQSFLKLSIIVFRERPDVVISTGAAPGLMGLMAAKILGIKTIWVDSMANAERLSMSGKLARKFADRIYTQWPELADEKVVCAGSVLS